MDKPNQTPQNSQPSNPLPRRSLDQIGTKAGSFLTNKLFLITVVILILFTIVYAGIYLSLNSKLDKITKPNPSPTTISQPSPTPGPKANWETYRNAEFGFEMKYPKEWNITTLFFDKEGRETKAIFFTSPFLVDANRGIGLNTFSNERSIGLERGVEEIKNNPKSYFLSDTVKCVDRETLLRTDCYAKGSKGIIILSGGIDDLNREYSKPVSQILSTFQFVTTPKPVSTRVAKEITITAKKNQWRFMPEEFEVNQGDRVVLTVVNEDDYDHGIGIDQYGISQRIPGNGIIKVEFVTTQAGDFPFYSSVPSGGGIVDGEKRTYYDMVGKIHVRSLIPEIK